MTAISREQLFLLVETAGRRPLRSLESTALRDGLTAALTTIDNLERKAATAADYEQVIQSQRAELLAAERARRTAGGLQSKVQKLTADLRAAEHELAQRRQAAASTLHQRDIA